MRGGKLWETYYVRDYFILIFIYLILLLTLQHPDHLVIGGELLPDDDAPAGGVHPHHAHHPLLVLPLKQQGNPGQEDLCEDIEDVNDETDNT